MKEKIFQIDEAHKTLSELLIKLGSEGYRDATKEEFDKVKKVMPGIKHSIDLVFRITSEEIEKYVAKGVFHPGMTRSVRLLADVSYSYLEQDKYLSRDMVEQMTRVCSGAKKYLQKE